MSFAPTQENSDKENSDKENSDKENSDKEKSSQESASQGHRGSRPDTDDFRHLFLNDIPLMDVRAPIEFQKGAFPCSENRPLLDDEQRQSVGTRYKQQGQDAAIELGWELATEDIRQQRLKVWTDFVRRHPDGYLYCFRGGLRSRLSQQLIREAGIEYPLVTGGYKAMRRFLIDELDQNCQSMPLVLIAGRTGSGKTRVIEHLSRAVDLEGLANHRGSAFGRRLQPQPAQIDFENSVSIELMKLLRERKPVFAEDEGRMIGAISMPLCLRDVMQQAPLAVLETSMDERIELVLQDYVTSSQPAYIKAFGEDEGREKFRQQILGNLRRIRKRLGGERFSLLQGIFTDALRQLDGCGDAAGFGEGIELLLREYYDPMYDYQQQQRQGREIFRGTMAEMTEWAEDYHSPP
ncbi:tRNA 2-selenouridine(34) synthase MnmH [Pseudomaricurvus alkylphenolicus]|uniref:tRNA 2-selenouridine(34) synthase MnmH n=1 Tax=Pseudomaricurvus alkylphenolicus TaxID=1306991 RepID=UPI00142361AD|nr:tRNA 2-selenouridine(34) synthase MnmH [Pseudomaricurvus alkylphenolicus]NIB43846.1 tRNA 2-selenouridine(34) synthase MnmH [Pseudomaricurvus alkylphenolicus]